MAISRVSPNNLAWQEQRTNTVSSQLGHIQEQLRDMTSLQNKTITISEVHGGILEPQTPYGMNNVPGTDVSNLEVSAPSPEPAYTQQNDVNDLAAPRKQRPVVYQQKRPSTAEDSILCLRATLRCPITCRCRCRCHLTVTIQTPTYIHHVIGAFFLSYNVRAKFQDQVCTFVGCSGPPSSRIGLQYHLPSWLASRGIQFSASWDSLHGRGATLHLKVPRILTDDHTGDIWHIITRGRLDLLRERLSSRKYLPTDIF